MKPEFADPGDLAEILQLFVAENREILEKLERDIVALERAPDDRDLVAAVFRGIHTIKGTSGFLGFSRLMAVTHAGESLLAPVRDRGGAITPAIAGALLSLVDRIRTITAGVESTSAEAPGDDSALLARLASVVPPASVGPADPGAAAGAPKPDPAVQPPATPPSHAPDLQDVESRLSTAGDRTIRVDVDLLDRLLDLTGELVLARNRFLQSIGPTPPQAAAAAQRLAQVANELQDTVARARMQPVGNLWRRFPRLVRDLALECGKKVRLETAGESTELDRSVLEALRDPLVHLLRNAVDHGIEKPEARSAAGKSEEGLLLFRAFHEGSQVIMEFSDDGRGIDVARVRSRAIDLGMYTREKLEAMGDADVTRLIFAPGFSTADQVTRLSGRGVGMDVVREGIEGLGGSIEISNRPGAGVTFRMRIPLTLAIISALVVQAKRERFAIPRANVREVVVLEGEEARKGVEVVHSVAVIRLRGTLLPLVYLDDQLRLGSSFDDPSVRGAVDPRLDIVVLSAEGRSFGLVVDGFEDTEDVVIRPVGPYLRGVPVYSGAAILRDGSVVLILDAPGLARGASVTQAPVDDEAESAPAAREASESFLLMASRDGGRLATPLEHVLRLEEIPAAAVERMGGQQVIQYRGKIMPLVDVSAALPDRRDRPRGAEEGGAEARLQIVVFGRGERYVGLVVNRILDIAESAVSGIRPGTRPGVAGCLVIRDKVTEVLDIPAILAAADPQFFGNAARTAPGPGAE